MEEVGNGRFFSEESEETGRGVTVLRKGLWCHGVGEKKAGEFFFENFTRCFFVRWTPPQKTMGFLSNCNF